MKDFRENRDREVSELLNQHGFSYSESVTVEFDGISHYFYKDISNNKRMFFSFYWQTQFNKTFWCGRLSVGFDYEPDNKYMHPIGSFHINNITEESIKHLPQLEKRLLLALEKQEII